MEKKITALEQQKNNPDRVNVYIDHEFAFGISRFVAAWLKQGDAIDESRIEQLLKQDAYEKAYQRALKFIAYQPRTETEIRAKLEKSNFENTTIDQVISELGEKNYLNDQQFAQDWIDSRANSKPRSKKFYSYELKKKGISEESINQALGNAPSDEELAFRLGCKYLNRFSYLNEADFQKKMQGVLARRAFSYDVTRKTIEKLLSKRKLEENG